MFVCVFVEDIVDQADFGTLMENLLEVLAQSMEIAQNGKIAMFLNCTRGLHRPCLRADLLLGRYCMVSDSD